MMNIRSVKMVILSVIVSVLPLLGTIPHDAKIYVSGHKGLVGAALVRKLQADGFKNIILRTSQELDLRNQAAVENFFAQERPEYVFHIAAKVGGIGAHLKTPADFICDNLKIITNVIDSAQKYGTKKLVYLGSSCIYPRVCPQPIKEEYLLSAPLEPSNEGYAVAKIAGIKLCQAFNRQYGTTFVSCMLPNMYGPGDNFNLETSHVLPALLVKIYQAKETGRDSVPVWGSGKSIREFLYVDDLADALVFLMENYNNNEIINIGTGQAVSISELANLIKKIVGFEGNLIFDSTKPEGTPGKVMDVSRINTLGWSAKVTLEDGIRKTLAWYAAHYDVKTNMPSMKS
jgi:GDP-L-fucose synthase